MPKTLFEDYLDGLYESTYDDKKIVKRLVKNLNFEFSADTKFDELFNLLRDNEEFKKLSSTNSRIALMDV